MPDRRLRDGQVPSQEHGLGAGPSTTFRRVTLPIIAPALFVGALMAFILSLNEFTIALFLATPEIETLPRVIWPNLRYTLTPLVAAASVVTMVLTLFGLAGAAWLLRLERFVDHLLGRRR
ncbi:MAG: ABC transporter permease subunit [Gemmataceae bacterium]|nr:ABC transporter permease subunit [Gemmataceae bacterium]